jgi:chromosome segregation ATPase
MRVNDIITEADNSSDYQQMQQFIKANHIPGIPRDQQIPLALFKELQKQKDQNQQLGAELDAAEQRIDQATQSGKLQGQELGMHRTELDRERKAGDQQRAAVDQLGQQYTERSKASAEQIADLSQQLEDVKTMPGVSQEAAKKLETQIKQLSATGLSAEKVKELESSIAAIQSAEATDDAAIQDLVKKINDAQAARATGSNDLEAQLDNLRRELDKLNTDYYETDATVLDLENEVATLKTERDTALAAKKEMTRLAKEKAAADAAKAAATPAPVASAPAPTQPQWSPAARATAQKLIAKGVLQPEPVAESAFKRSIAWATGKTK